MQVTSRNMWAAAGSLAALALTSCGQKDERMNIVYIMTDDHTAQMMSCYDTRYAHTPNLDRIAQDGVRFTNSFVANSLSGPSRACLVTGKHSHANGFTDNTTCVFDSSQQTFPKLLQQAGYETALIGKWHLESLPTGFSYWEILPGQGDYYNPDFINMQGDTVQVHGYLTDIITDKALTWIDKVRRSRKPFCILIHHKAQHRNWMADTTNLALYEDMHFDLPDTFWDTYEGRPAAAAQQMSILRDMDDLYDLKMYRDWVVSDKKDKYEKFTGRMDAEQKAAWDRFYEPLREEFYALKPSMTLEEYAAWKFDRYVKDYLKVLKSLDDNVGRVLDYLDEKGLSKNTLVVYTSDQGFYIGEHGWFDKRFMYEESLNTPLVVRMPGGVSGQVSNLMVQNIDHASTFLELAGVPVPEDMQGLSYLPALRGETPSLWRTGIYYHYYEYPAEHSVKRHYGVRTDRFKLIHFYNDIDHWEMYDLLSDPHELHSVYGAPEYAAVQAQLMDALRSLQAQYNTIERD